MVERKPSLIRSVSARISSLRRPKGQPQPSELADSPSSAQGAFVTVRRNPSSTGSSSSKSSADNSHQIHTVVKHSAVDDVSAQQDDYGLGYSSIGYERSYVSSNRHSRTVIDPAQTSSLSRSSSLNIPRRKSNLTRSSSVAGRPQRVLSTAYEYVRDADEDLNTHMEQLSLLPDAQDKKVTFRESRRTLPRSLSTSSVRSSAPRKSSRSPPPKSPYTIIKPQHQTSDSAEFIDVSQDVLQNVKDHMKAQRDLLGLGPFYAVARGWKKGVYASQDEALRQIRNFPGPAMLKFEDLQQALLYVETNNLPTSSTTIRIILPHAEQDEERLERTRIFTGREPASAEACRKTDYLSSELNEHQHRARLGLLPSTTAVIA